jgi:hypothetical protein
MEYKSRKISGQWRRLIPSRFPPVDVYERLGPELARFAPEVEALTNPRLQSRRTLMQGAEKVPERSPRLQNWNHAPFAYKNPEGSTFLDKAYGALEVAESVEAALAIALRRREIFLSRTSEPPMNLDMRLLITKVEGDFVDLTGLSPDLDRESRHDIGRKLYEDGAAGVIFRSPHRPAAACLAIFTGDVLGTTVQGAHYRFVWDGQVVRTVYDFSPPGVGIPREDLIKEDRRAA